MTAPLTVAALIGAARLASGVQGGSSVWHRTKLPMDSFGDADLHRGPRPRTVRAANPPRVWRPERVVFAPKIIRSVTFRIDRAQGTNAGLDETMVIGTLN